MSGIARFPIRQQTTPHMTESILLIAAGVALLYGGAEGLVRGSVALAVRLGLTPLVIGLTVVAFGTSMPELVVSVGASLQGSGSIAVGNVVGSNIGNVALILGLCVLITPTNVRAQVVRVEVPFVVLVSVFVSMLLWDGSVGRLVGGVLILLLLAYLFYSVRKARKEPRSIEREYEEALPEVPGSLWLDVLLLVLGLAFLVAGARMMVSGAVAIAEAAGVSQAVIGLTIVAIGTSLPELATSAVAAVKGEGDIAVGNVVGSNLFNLLGILGLAALVRPIHDAHVGLVSLFVMTVLALALIPLMYSGGRLSRPEGALLMTSYAAYMIYLVA